MKENIKAIVRANLVEMGIIEPKLHVAVTSLAVLDIPVSEAVLNV